LPVSGPKIDLLNAKHGVKHKSAAFGHMESGLLNYGKLKSVFMFMRLLHTNHLLIYRPIKFACVYVCVSVEPNVGNKVMYSMRLRDLLQNQCL
jgi:hypothetical protein